MFFLKRSLLAVLVAFLVMFMSIDALMADRIYQWVDSAGIKHFTNNKLNIPSQYRVKIKDMKLKVVKAGDKRLPVAASGEKLWLARCAACHVAGAESKVGLSALGPVVIDPATRFSRSPDVLSSVFRGAVEGRTTDMKRMEISDAELYEIARYLIEYSKKH